MSKQGKVIDFFDHVPLRYRLDAAHRAYGRHKADNKATDSISPNVRVMLRMTDCGILFTV